MGPLRIQTEALVQLTLNAEHTCDFRSRRVLGHVVDISLGYAVLLSRHEGKHRPTDDIIPLAVALSSHRAKRFLRDRFR